MPMSEFDIFIDKNENVINEMENTLQLGLPVTVETGDLSGHGMEMRFEMIVAEEKVKLFGEAAEVPFNSSHVIFSLFELTGSGKIKPELDIKFYSVASLGYEDKSTYQFTGEDSEASMLAWYKSQKKAFGIPDVSDDMARSFFEAIIPVLGLLK